MEIGTDCKSLDDEKHLFMFKFNTATPSLLKLQSVKCLLDGQNQNMKYVWTKKSVIL